MAVKFKLLPKKSGVDKTSDSPVKEGIYFDNLKWHMDDEKTIMSIDATKLGVTVSVKDHKIKKNPKIQNRLEGCIRIVEGIAIKRLNKKMSNQEK